MFCCSPMINLKMISDWRILEPTTRLFQFDSFREKGLLAGFMVNSIYGSIHNLQQQYPEFTLAHDLSHYTASQSSLLKEISRQLPFHGSLSLSTLRGIVMMGYSMSVEPQGNKANATEILMGVYFSLVTISLNLQGTSSGH